MYTNSLQTAVAKKLAELYVTRRNEYLLQKKDGTYTWFSAFKLHDNRLINHVKGSETIGIFSGQIYSKVLIFDVDTKENAEIDARHLINVLENDFNINREYINVVFSGNKGYHVTLYFDDVVGLKLLYNFYLKVIEIAGFTTEQVELRPLHKQGVKLPLGIHKKTNKRCWFVDNQIFKHIRSFKYIFNVKVLDANNFVLEQTQLLLDDITFLNDEQKIDLAKIDSVINLSTEDKLYYSNNLNQILEYQTLLKANTRNSATLFLAMFLKNAKGLSERETVDIITDIMINTKRTKKDFIESSENSIKTKTKAVVKCVYKHNYKISTKINDVYFTKDEILHLLSIEKWNAKLLFFVHLVQSKRYISDDATYYISYNQMLDMLAGTFTSRQAVSNQIKYLVQKGYLEVVTKGYYNSNTEVSCATTYKIAHTFKESDEKILIGNNERQFKLDFEKFLLDVNQELNLNIKYLLQTRSQREKLTKYKKERGL